MSRKFAGLAFWPSTCETRAAIGTADTPAEPINGFTLPPVSLYITLPNSRPPTVENVKSGDYQVARPFNIVTKDGLSDVAQDFIDFIMSSDGQKIVEEEGYISVADSAAAYTGSGQSGKIVIAGSSSVTPVMEKLAEAYKAINSGVAIEVNQSDSTTGVNMATEGTCDIGMVSRELKDSETGVTPTVIAQDGIAIIVNNASTVDGLSSEQVKGIYTGEIANWEDVLA